MPGNRFARELLVPVDDVELAVELAIPDEAKGLVLFAHGSGSGRHSPRNQYVARTLRERQLGTLLFDLLTADEERVDAADAHLRFDIPMLARRLGKVTDWIHSQDGLRKFPIGYFGASTGAAAALIAASERLETVRAVVSRGGRADLAKLVLSNVWAPTLLIVGGQDPVVLQLNQDAFEQMPGNNQLVIVRGTTHLFEEPGALEEVAGLAASWFTQHFGASPEAGVGTTL